MASPPKSAPAKPGDKSAEKAAPKKGAADAASAGLLRRLLKGRAKWALLGLLPLLLLPLVVLPAVQPKPVPPPIPPKPEEGLAALDRGNFAEAVRIAERLTKFEMPPEVQGVSPFIRGSVAASQAGQLWGKDSTRYYVLAARFLQQARTAGFPEGREAIGLYLLGKSLHLSGQSVPSREYLERALEHESEDRTEIHRLLTEAYLNDAQPDIERALDHNSHYLAGKSISATERYDGLLLRADIFLKAGDVEACQSTLKTIPGNSRHAATAAVLRGQLLMRDAEALQKDAALSATDEGQTQIANKYQEAITQLQQGLARNSQSTPAAQRASYLIGMCWLQIGDSRAALDQLGKAAKTATEGSEAVAANLQYAELLRQVSRDDEAVEAYREAVAAAGEPASFSNPWVTLEDFRTRLMAPYQQYLEQEDFAHAVAIAEVLPPFYPPGQCYELAGQAYRQWAADLQAKAAAAVPTQANALHRSAREQLRNAGRTYSRLAALNMPTKRYTDDVWQSAECLLQGNDYRSAVKMLEEYLRYEQRKRRPRALVFIGEARLALGQPDAALTPLIECIDFFTTDASSYQARLLASRAYLEKNDTVHAEALLRENLDGANLAPASWEWRDSLFALGRLLQNTGRQQEALLRLEEAVARYPEAPQTLEARYLIGEAYRQLAIEPREKLKAATLESARVAHSQEMQQTLRQALVQYDHVQTLLGRRQQHSELSQLENAILRNCHFARGAALFELGRYPESIAAYSTASNRYQHSPESLEALVQIATCYRRMNKPQEARGTLQQAKLVLSRMKDDADFASTSVLDRQGWNNLLDWMEQL